MDQIPDQNTSVPTATLGGRLLRFLPLILMVGLIIAVYATGANRWFAFDTLRARHEELTSFVQDHFWLALFLYLLLYSALTAIALPGAVFVTLTGGFLFGTWIGGPVTALAATLGAVVVYSVTRTAFGAFLRERAQHGGPAVRGMQRVLEENAFWGLLSLRLAPVVPFVLVNIVAGVVSMRMRPFFLATFLGTLPAMLIYSSIGAGLDQAFAENRGIRFSDPHIWVPLAGLFLLSLLPFVFRRKRAPVAE
jgi:uncharacterized membrane protein YdjX (TVP38/TMEM64 family)